VLAQHEDDQLETLLLQLARGAGSKGLSCMPVFHAKLKIWRPLLGVSKDLIHGYQQEHKLKFIEDSSNQDNKYDRNYLRNKVIPLIKKRFPQFAMTSGRSVKHIADAYNYQNLINSELYKNVHEGASQLNGLKLKKLSDYDMGNVIRFWLNEHQVLMPSIKVLRQIISQVKKIDLESCINIKVDEVSIRSYNNSLFLINNSENSFKSVLWKDHNKVILSNNREVLVDKKVGKGLSLDESKKIVIEKPHNMNLKIKIKANQPARSLKYIFQENKIPPWERENYPCLYVEDKLVSVIGLADSVEYAANKKESGVTFKYKLNPSNTGI